MESEENKEQKVEEVTEEPEETEELLERKNKLNDLTVFLKKYNKRVPDCILVRDFPKIIRLLGHDPTEKEIEDYIKNNAKYDRDPDGLIENKTLFSILEERAKAPDTPEELKKAFLQLADEEGKLLKEELRYHMRTMGEPMEEKDVKKFLEAGTDTKDERYFNIDQFVEAVFKKKNAKK